MAESIFRFKPQAIPTLIMILLLPLFGGLGIWQLERAGQKRALMQTYEMRQQMPAMDLNRSIPQVEEARFRLLQASGSLLLEKSVLIENRKHQGRIGYHVLTPLRLTNSESYLLVNRGWTANPEIVTSEQLADPLTVSGSTVVPAPPPLKLERPVEDASSSDQPPRWPYITLDEYAAWSGLTLLPFMLLQSPEDSQGYLRSWPEPRPDDAMHIGYAIQWFAFALIVLAIWFRLSISRQAAPPVQA